ncbi:MAG: hypothetical protein KTR31_09755 [Myxococcales bacterium]|nr:hypothetical protein [Myxococcales bacterium]
MQTRRHYPFSQTVRWSARFFVGPALWAASVVAAYVLLDFPAAMRVPWTVAAVLGTAVAFFVGFKNNASYGRLWEARKIWGAIVNTSRSWAITVQGFVTDEFATAEVAHAEVLGHHRELILRHLAWLAALRHHLRRQQTWEHTGRKDDAYIRSLCHECKTPMAEDLALFVEPDEVEQLVARSNRATHLLSKQATRLKELKRQGLIDNWRHMELQKLLIVMFDHQGKCERIKNFPFPRQYASYTLYTVYLFAALLPFGMLDVFGEMGPWMVWMVIPSAALLAWVYFTAELIGDYSENPFEGLWNDIPITALSRTIEIDLKELLDEPEIPEPLKPGYLGLLN